MVLVMFIVLVYAMGKLGSTRDSLGGDIGKKQAEIFKTYQSGENVLFYIDQAAKISSERAIYDLGQKGGFSERSNCGVLSGYYFWQRGSEECYPENVKGNFYKFLDINLNQHIDNYNILAEAKVPLSNYGFMLNNKKLIGNAFENININIYDTKNEPTLSDVGRYSIKPSFTVDVSSDLSEYKSTIQLAKEIFSSCKDTNDVFVCAQILLKRPEFSSWKLSKLDQAKFTSFNQRDRVLLFDVSTGNIVSIYKDNKINKENVVIKFGMYLQSETTGLS